MGTADLWFPWESNPGRSLCKADVSAGVIMQHHRKNNNNLIIFNNNNFSPFKSMVPRVGGEGPEGAGVYFLYSCCGK